MDKKGQNGGQILLYILGGVVFVIILYFGYKALVTTNDATSNVVYVQFTKKIQKDATEMSQTFGSVKTYKYQLPNGYTKMCIVTDSSARTGNALVDDSVSSSSSKNIFLIGPDKFDSLSIANIKVENANNFICKNLTSNEFTVKFKGQSDIALIVG